MSIFDLLRRQAGGERGSEVTEQIFWIGLIILAIVLLLPQLRNALMDKLSELISVLSQ